MLKYLVQKWLSRNEPLGKLISNDRHVSALKSYNCKRNCLGKQKWEKVGEKNEQKCRGKEKLRVCLIALVSMENVQDFILFVCTGAWLY